MLTSTSSDSHTWNLVYLQMFIEELGHDVRNLGSCVPDELLRREATGTSPDLIVISTVNGHGMTDGARAVRILRGDPVLRETPIVIGGKLGVTGTSSPEDVAALVDAGFTAVFGGDEIDVTLFGSFVESIATRVTS